MHRTGHPNFNYKARATRPSHKWPDLKRDRNSGAKESVFELDSGPCSARLQAGICLIPECPPEGGRYKNAAILSFRTDSKAPVFQARERRDRSRDPQRPFMRWLQ
jgi:hypothetical protein